MGAFNALFGEDTQASDNQSNIVAPKKSPFANKNQQIQQLQTINPQHLATGIILMPCALLCFLFFSLVNDLSFYLVLQQGLASLEATVANVSLMASGNPPQHQSQQRTHQRQRPASASPAMVELFEGSGVMISPLSLTNAISYGLAGNNKR